MWIWQWDNKHTWFIFSHQIWSNQSSHWQTFLCSAEYIKTKEPDRGISRNWWKCLRLGTLWNSPLIFLSQDNVTSVWQVSFEPKNESNMNAFEKGTERNKMYHIVEQIQHLLYSQHAQVKQCPHAPTHQASQSPNGSQWTIRHRSSEHSHGPAKCKVIKEHKLIFMWESIHQNSLHIPINCDELCIVYCCLLNVCWLKLCQL